MNTHGSNDGREHGEAQRGVTAKKPWQTPEIIVSKSSDTDNVFAIHTDANLGVSAS